MSESNVAKLRQLDMMLLMVFAEALRNRKLTVVATRLGLTPSAVSHSLKRLREEFDDELFMRRPFGVAPTQRALEIAPQVEAILDLTRSALGRPESFEPQTSSRLFRIAMPDHELSLFAPTVIHSLRRQAPGIRVDFRPQTRQAAITALAEGEIDLAVGLLRAPSAEFDKVELFEENYLVLARRRHPGIIKALDLKTYVALDHLLVSPGGGLKGIVDGTLAKLGHRRNVVAAVPSF